MRNAVRRSSKEDALIFLKITPCNRFRSSAESFGNLTANESLAIQETRASVRRKGAWPSSKSKSSVRRLPNEIVAVPNILQPVLERSLRVPSPLTIRAPSSPEKKAHESSEEREPSKISPKPAVKYWARLRSHWVAASRCSSTLKMAKPPCASPMPSSPGSPKIHLPLGFQSSQQKNGN